MGVPVYSGQLAVARAGVSAVSELLATSAGIRRSHLAFVGFVA